jgi:hypothetical protein
MEMMMTNLEMAIIASVEITVRATKRTTTN